MKIISISTPKEPWSVAVVRPDGTLWRLPIEQWALVQWELHQDGPDAYAKGQSVVPAVMGPGGFKFITEPIGAPGCRYLGFDHTGFDADGRERDWVEERTAYLKTKEPS